MTLGNYMSLRVSLTGKGEELARNETVFHPGHLDAVRDFLRVPGKVLVFVDDDQIIGFESMVGILGVRDGLDRRRTHA